MPIYLMPPLAAPNDELHTLTTRSGVDFIEVEALYEMWRSVAKGGITLAAIPVQQVMILQRHMDALLPELPSVVTGVNGAAYTAEWNTITAHLPSVPYSSLEQQMLKSGFLANNTTQAEARGSQQLAPMPSIVSNIMTEKEDDDAEEVHFD